MSWSAAEVGFTQIADLLAQQFREPRAYESGDSGHLIELLTIARKPDGTGLALSGTHEERCHRE